jgi:nitrate/TMAO reductase-like tetraheme cytochrome c subunit
MIGSGSLRHPVALAGVVIATVGAVAFLTLLVADLLGLFTNPYAGLVIFIAVPALFVFGLLLIPLGIWLYHRALRRDPSRPVDWPVIDLGRSRVRAILIGVTAMTVVNATLVLLAAQGSLHYMESPEFCGQTCHTPMHPQYTSWQNTTHAEVACVQCHVGEGARALVRSKLAGVRQLLHIVNGHYPRPIPASQAELRPALETCGNCHSPLVGHGVRTRTVREYAEDEANTETATTLALHIGGPDEKTASGRAIHWHADPRVRVEYIATDPDRQTIPFVRTIDEKGKTKEYVVEGTSPETLAAGTTRTMDCIDCHNAAAHRISPTAEQAVNRAMAAGRISPALPFVRREAVRLLKSDYRDEATAIAAIESGFRTAYGPSKAHVDHAALSQAIATTQSLYRTNVFPAMKVTWGVYLDNRGHTTSNGCFRCHDGSHVARDGSAINADCAYCHDLP